MNILVSALIITLLIPSWGLIIELLNMLIYKIVRAISSPKIALICVNYLTFPGVIHHELSHALFAFVTGAKITQFRPFWPDKRTGTLGQVSFIARGTFFTKALQLSLSSTAPVIMGTISSLLILGYMNSHELPLYLVVLLTYLIIAIVIHASMSYADVKVMLKGIWVIFLIAFVICLYYQIDIIQLIRGIY